jgi:catechol 2,3-dioxygenase-like lactoylglutathione lyase family enzyme
MIGHIGFPVSDYERAKTLYAAALATLGYTLIMEVDDTMNPSGHPAAGFGAQGLPPHDHADYHGAFVLDPQRPQHRSGLPPAGLTRSAFNPSDSRSDLALLRRIICVKSGLTTQRGEPP